MKRAIILIISLAVVSFIGFCTFAIPTVSAYDQEIYQAQKALKELGYTPGKVDGLWGKATERAIERFQRESRLPLTGRLDGETKKRLGLAPAKGRYG